MRRLVQTLAATAALGISSFAYGQQPDLTIVRVLGTNAPSNPYNLSISGSVDVVVQNIGTVASTPCSVVVFTDLNDNRQYDAGTDLLLGTGSVPAISAGLTATVTVAVSGLVLFWDGWISAYVDFENAVAESDETNNYNNTGSVCGGSVRSGTLNPQLKWHWGVDNPNNPPRGQYYSNHTYIMNAPIVVDMDRDGYPEVIFAGAPTYPSLCSEELSTTYIFVLDGRDGSQKWVSPQGVRVNALAYPAAGDLDGNGYPEVVFPTPTNLLFLEYDSSTSTYRYTFSQDTLPSLSWGSVTIANLDQSGFPEIVIGDTVFRANGARLWQGGWSRGSVDFCYSANSLVADVDLDGVLEVVAGPTVYNPDGTIKYRNTSLTDGFVATANFDTDPQAEIVLVSRGRVYILEHDLSLVRSADIPGGGFGGPPMIGDVDGDGIPEICIAGRSQFVVFRPDLSILWQASCIDESSRTGATLFDFDGDGRAELVYRDEVYLRIYDGRTGQVLWQVPMSSGTIIEYPKVVDLDRDERADIIVSAARWRGGSQQGIYVYSDPTWFPTRSIWNQHHYCITNVNDDGSIPTTEPPSWLVHNTYRLNPTFNPATPLPDLSVSVPRYCTDRPDIVTVRVGNGGSADVNTPFIVAVYDGDPDNGGQIIGQATLNSLSAGQYVDVDISLPDPNNRNPRYVRVDVGSAIRECNENNNTLLAFTGCRADINRDGVVDDTDLLAVLFDFGARTQHPFYLPTDIDCNRVVDDDDLLIQLLIFGEPCP